jgi:undecaprenyl diphosphate synthase
LGKAKRQNACLNGVKAVRDTVEGAAEIGVKFLTLYAFSTENWNRPRYEINALMELLVSTISKEKETLNKNNIRLLAIGDLKSLPEKCYRELMEAIDDTSKNDRMSLVLALSYSSKWELTEAVKEIAKKVEAGEINSSSITEQVIADHLYTKGMPDPELLIRTSGECRISNFLLWQIAYSELYFTEKLWPDFRREDLYEALVSYQQRERRFGMTSEQLSR